MNRPPPIIPVLDLMIGQIVLAVGGKRDDYRPVDSKLTRSSQPLDVAKAIFLQTGCDCLYLADIDSFSGAEPNWSIYNQLLNAGFGLWIDANWLLKNRTEKIVSRIDDPSRLKIILSSETMASVAEFDRLGQLIAEGVRVVFSLDLVDDTVITRPGELGNANALELIQHAYSHGVRELIVLDLAGVGTLRGLLADSSLSELFQEIADELPDLTLTSGGGVRFPDDAQAFLDAGCHHVLVASAIHDCQFTPDDVEELLPPDILSNK